MNKNFIISLICFSCLAGTTTIALGFKLEANLRFSHKTHNKNCVTCERCHVDIAPTTTPKNKPAADLPPGWEPLRKSNIVTQGKPLSPHGDMGGSFGRPSEKRCLVCHFKTREKSECALCHLDKPGETKRSRVRLDKRVSFNHSKHSDISCITCHQGITNWDNLDGHKINVMKMEDCLECHNKKQAPKNCQMCHNPTPHPKDHIRNYEKKHGMAYRTNPQRCRMCHQESSCLECHARKPRNHTLAWVSRRHGLTAKTNPMKCQACHADRHVCLRCHSDMR